MAGMNSKFEKLLAEASFHATRSGGSGGQNVNKVSTKVELRFDVSNSSHLTEIQKKKILNKHGNRVSSEGILILTADDTRSQFKNREIVSQRFMKLIGDALKREKKRVPTEKTKTSIEKTLKKKKIRGEKKQLRKKIDPGRI